MEFDLLGYCRYCFRVRWLAVVEQTKPNPEGKCRQCEREHGNEEKVQTPR
jgi:hypothetical protein